MAELIVASFEPLQIEIEGKGFEDSPWAADWKAFLERLHSDPELFRQLGSSESVVATSPFATIFHPQNIQVVPEVFLNNSSRSIIDMELRTSDGRVAAVEVVNRRFRDVSLSAVESERMSHAGRYLAHAAASYKDQFVLGIFLRMARTPSEASRLGLRDQVHAPMDGEVTFEWRMRADFVLTTPVVFGPRSYCVGATVLIGYRPRVERATLRNLFITGVGPAEVLDMSPLAPRINLITGDNGLGKTFLLDAVWWILTGTWHRFAAVPSRQDAQITGQVIGTRGDQEIIGDWDPSARIWQEHNQRPETNSLVIYMRVDGSFSVMDPRRNNRRYQRPDGTTGEMPRAFQFSAQEAMEGLEIQDRATGAKQKVCMGLVHDWVDWQQTNDPRFRFLEQVLARLGAEGESLVPGTPAQPFLPVLDRKYPTIKMKYDQEVPVVYAPAGIQRACILAYLLAWSFAVPKSEKALEEWTPVGRVALLVDEIETHLHPRWQRTMLPSLIGAIEDLNDAVGRRGGGLHCDAQVFVATHSPLVLASVEPRFDTTLDAVWKLELVPRQANPPGDNATVSTAEAADVQLSRQQWQKRGDITHWLTSLFDLPHARSLEADIAIRQAMQLVLQKDPDVQKIRELTTELQRVLPETDRTWVRWAEFAEKHGVVA